MNCVIEVMDERMEALRKWLSECTPYGNAELESASADASFRRYFRIRKNQESYVVMDAPPEKEPCEPFVRIGEWMKRAGIRVPNILEKNMDLGFMVLTDFGDLHFQEAIQGCQRDHLYDLAMSEILRFQTRLRSAADNLPVFDPAWQHKELEIFRTWCLPDTSIDSYHAQVDELVREVDQMPKNFMHRDFHCRNLLLPEDGRPAVIDFQGAMLGPVTYDLASLLRDCYVDNSEKWISEKVLSFQEQLRLQGALKHTVDAPIFMKWFDFSGLQRHLKCIGIFHRLTIRDGKSDYLKDIPRILGYVDEVLNRYGELKAIRSLIKQARIMNFS